MTGYNPLGYGQAVGSDYDELYPGTTTESAVAFLAELASAHPAQSVLEFGVGTGRLALPLSRAGLRVAGIDSAQHMVDAMREKPGGRDIEVSIGDFRHTTIDPAGFAVVVLPFNGMLDPRGYEAQIDIVSNAAHHLADGGAFVVEAFVLDEAQRSGEWTVNPRYVADGHAELHFVRYDIDTNRVDRTFVHLRPGDTRFVTVVDTYLAPGELDILAAPCGFAREARYGGWDRTPFTASSTNHVTVLRKKSETPG